MFPPLGGYADGIRNKRWEGRVGGWGGVRRKRPFSINFLGEFQQQPARSRPPKQSPCSPLEVHALPQRWRGSPEPEKTRKGFQFYCFVGFDANFRAISSHVQPIRDHLLEPPRFPIHSGPSSTTFESHYRWKISVKCPAGEETTQSNHWPPTSRPPSGQLQRPPAAP